MSLSQEEIEAIIETCLEAAADELFIPLSLAMGTLTLAALRDRPTAQWAAETLLAQARSCPERTYGRAILESLAAFAAAPTPPSPDDLQAELRKHLRLIQGGRAD